MQSDISFFYKPSFRHRDDNHLMRGSSIIRGDQMVEYLGAKKNPVTGFDNDVCIYIKPNNHGELYFHDTGSPYLDIVDGWALRHPLKKQENVCVIACSEYSAEVLRDHLPRHRIIVIPQHHCNFERAKRDRREIKTIGMIGTNKVREFIPEVMLKEISRRGLRFILYTEFKKRQDVIDFYKSIDLQVVWRPYQHVLQNPLKVVNALSFGIPTIALDEQTFKEVDGCYIPVDDAMGFIDALDGLLASDLLYNEYADRCLLRAEDYHIDSIAKLYKQLT